MKKLSILSLLFLSILAGSCKRTIDKADAPVIESRNLNIVIQSAVATRAAQEATGDESKINNGWCFVFRGNSGAATLDCAPAKLNTTAATNTIKVTSEAQTVFVVANAENFDPSSIRNIDDLKAKTSDLFSLDAITQKENNLTMWGQGLVDKTAQTYTSVVTMRFAPAKINFTYSIDASQDGLLSNPEIVVLNAQGLTRLIPDFTIFQPSKAEGEASLMPAAPKFYSAIDDFGQGDTKEALKVVKAEQKVTSTFYLFENTSSTASIIAVRGTYAGVMTYFPIHFSAADKGDVKFEPITSGKIFNVNAKINHLSGGVTDPTTPVEQTTLEVTIIPATWHTVIAWEKEFD